MSKVLSEKAAAVLTHLQATAGTDEDFRAVAAGAGIDPKAVTGVVNGLVKKGLVERVEVEGMDTKVIRLTAQGAVFNPDEEKVEAE